MYSLARVQPPTLRSQPHITDRVQSLARTAGVVQFEMRVAMGLSYTYWVFRWSNTRSRLGRMRLTSRQLLGGVCLNLFVQAVVDV